MIVGLYTSATGKMAMAKNLEVISRNLANVNTTGFKRNVAVFRTFLENDPSVPGASLARVEINHSQGSIKGTGNKLDLAIYGNGYFALDTGDGMRYSRNGHFRLNGDMEIVNDVGWKLEGESGVIKLPRNAKDVMINDEGAVMVDGVRISKINIVDFANKEVLKEAGNSSFRTNPNNRVDIAEGYVVQQGFLETSNVSVIDEMVNMMSNMRTFQANNSVSRTINGTLEKLIRTAYTVI
ncbi:MAG: flagellar hook-basal body protein [Candidatus Anammoxibacter sp.]